MACSRTPKSSESSCSIRRATSAGRVAGAESCAARPPAAAARIANASTLPAVDGIERAYQGREASRRDGLKRRPKDADHTETKMGKEPESDEGEREFEDVHGEEADLGPTEDIVEVGGAGDLDELEDIDEVERPNADRRRPLRPPLPSDASARRRRPSAAATAEPARARSRPSTRKPGPASWRTRRPERGGRNERGGRGRRDGGGDRSRRDRDRDRDRDRGPDRAPDAAPNAGQTAAETRTERGADRGVERLRWDRTWSSAASPGRLTILLARRTVT